MWQSLRFYNGMNDRYEVRLSIPDNGNSEYWCSIPDSDTQIVDASGRRVPFRIRRAAALDLLYAAIIEDARMNQAVPRQVILDDAEYAQIMTEYMAEEAATKL